MTDQEEFEKWAVNKNIDWESMFIKRDISFFNHGWQACAKRKNIIIDKQDHELESLREFANAILSAGEYIHARNFSMVFGLIDEEGNPTSLLTGKQK